MPVTAKHVCRDYKIKCDIPRLMKDPAYNTMLGSAYITDRMDEFTRLLRADAGRLQRRARAARASGSRSSATPATARSTPSTGSTASPSRRRASTCRRCSPTSRSTARAWASATPSASPPTSSASRLPPRLPRPPYLRRSNSRDPARIRVALRTALRGRAVLPPCIPGQAPRTRSAARRAGVLLGCSLSWALRDFPLAKLRKTLIDTRGTIGFT